jgi:hypothetical protein
MKHIKKSLALFILLSGIGSAFIFSAFKDDIPRYQYLSNSKDEIDIKNISNWKLVDDESSDCGLAGSLVCQYSFDGDIHDFQSFLELPSTTAVMINAGAESTKR